MVYIIRMKYTDTLIVETAAKYSSVDNWRRNDNGTYQAAKVRKMLGHCTVHMVDLRTVKKYTDQEVIEKSKKYTSSTEWRMKDVSSYNLAKRRKLLPQCTAHMPRKAGIYSGIYQVYAYKFPGNVAYIGLTCVPERRHECHMRGGRVLRMATQIGVPVPSPVVLESNIMSPQEAQEAERTWITKYTTDGYQLLNISAGGSVGAIGKAIKTKWPKEKVLEIASQFDTVKDWVSRCGGSYAAASKQGWLPEATAHMVKPQKWTVERIKETALGYTDLTQFCKEQSSCATIATRRKIFREVTAHITRKLKRVKA